MTVIKLTAKTMVILMIISILAGMVMPFPSYANPLEELKSEKLAISLVIDTSGSMLTTDPLMFREKVANTFIELLYPEDYLGIVTFNSNVDLIVPMTKMDGDDSRNNIKTQIAGRLTSDGDTDYKAALDMSNTQLQELDDPEVRKLIIFLTDGKPDPDPVNITNNPKQMAEYMEGLWGSLTDISRNGYPVYSIGFSEGIDVDVLNRIASETSGDVRIFTDSNDLDVNLIQVLQSREILVEELLAPAIIQEAIGKPVLQNEFWPKKGGYRIGEWETIVASIRVGNRSVGEGPLLKVDSFNFVVEKDDGGVFRLPLYDDGGEISGDIMGGDGRWTNRLEITSEYTANVSLEATGLYREEAFALRKDLGEIFSAVPGTVVLKAGKEDLWVRSGEALTIPVEVENRSPFAEMLGFSAEGNLGDIRNSQIEVGPDTTKTVNLYIDTDSGIEKGSDDLRILVRALYPETELENATLEYRVERVGFFGSIVNNLQENYFILSIIVGIFIVLPLVIWILGNLFYLILLAPAIKIRGTLTYWKESKPKDKKDLNLKERKKREVMISMDMEDKADFNLHSTRYSFDIFVGKKLLVEGRKFVLGWKKLFSNKPMTSTYIKTTQPGILHFRNDIYTEMNLYDGMEFVSGDYHFRYSMGDAKWSKGEEAGKDFLEGRTNGF